MDDPLGFWLFHISYQYCVLSLKEPTKNIVYDQNLGYWIKFSANIYSDALVVMFNSLESVKTKKKAAYKRRCAAPSRFFHRKIEKL